MAMPVVELACYAASGVFLIGGIILAERERAASNASQQLLQDEAHRETVSRFGGTPVPSAPLVPQEVEVVRTETQYVEVPIEVEKRVEVAVIPTSPLDNPPLLHLIEETARLQEELYQNATFFTGERREVLDHVLSKLNEILERVPEVDVLQPQPGEPFQRGLHRTVKGKPPTTDATISTVTVPGVRVAERVLRPAVVEISEP